MSYTEIVDGKRDWSTVKLPEYLNRCLMVSNIDMLMVGLVLEECGFSKEYGSDLWFLGEPFCEGMRGQIEVGYFGNSEDLCIKSSDHIEAITDFKLLFDKIREHWDL